jgi:MSHA biogenesis protein MshN
MSLINQMLQDLEKRHASGVERGALPDQVRVLPREEARSMPWWMIGISAAAAGIAVLAWQFNYRAPPTASAPMPPGAAAQPQIAPIAVTPAPVAQIQEQKIPVTTLTPGAPASRLTLDLEKVPLAIAPAPARTREPVPRTTAAPPVATDSVVASGKAVTAKPGSNDVRADAARPATVAVELSKIAPAVAATPTAVPIKPAITMSKAGDTLPDARVQAALSNSQIDKRAQTLTPQQVAENEYRDAANFLNQGRLAEAQEGFRRALQNYPAHVGARQGLFGVLLDAKKNGEAEQVLQEGLRLNPNQPGFAMALASLQYERGDIAGSIETMQKAAPAAQASPDYLARLAGLLQRQSRHKEAVDYYQAALRLAPGSGVWLMGMGISLQSLNRNSDAAEAFRRAKSSNTLSPDLLAFVDQRLKQLQ